MCPPAPTHAWPNDFPKVKTPNTITLEIKVSTYDYGEDTDI